VFSQSSALDDDDMTMRSECGQQFDRPVAPELVKVGGEAGHVALCAFDGGGSVLSEGLGVVKEDECGDDTSLMSFGMLTLRSERPKSVRSDSKSDSEDKDDTSVEEDVSTAGWDGITLRSVSRPIDSPRRTLVDPLAARGGSRSRHSDADGTSVRFDVEPSVGLPLPDPVTRPLDMAASPMAFPPPSPGQPFDARSPSTEVDASRASLAAASERSALSRGEVAAHITDRHSASSGTADFGLRSECEEGVSGDRVPSVLNFVLPLSDRWRKTARSQPIHDDQLGEGAEPDSPRSVQSSVVGEITLRSECGEVPEMATATASSEPALFAVIAEDTVSPAYRAPRRRNSRSSSLKLDLGEEKPTIPFDPELDSPRSLLSMTGEMMLRSECGEPPEHRDAFYPSHLEQDAPSHSPRPTRRVNFVEQQYPQPRLSDLSIGRHHDRLSSPHDSDHDSPRSETRSMLSSFAGDFWPTEDADTPVGHHPTPPSSRATWDVCPSCQKPRSQCRLCAQSFCESCATPAEVECSEALQGLCKDCQQVVTMRTQKPQADGQPPQSDTTSQPPTKLDTSWMQF